MEIDLDKIKKLPTDVQKEFMTTFLKYQEKKKESLIYKDFMAFVKHVWPDFIEGSHHKIIADKFNKLAEGKIKRLIINMPPRHTKSEFASFLLPAWMVGRNPKLKIIQSTHTTELAVRFGRKAKTLMDSEEYKQVYTTTVMIIMEMTTNRLKKKIKEEDNANNNIWNRFLYILISNS